MSFPMQDVRYAVRGMRRNRGVSIVAILTLALGVGAATTVFTVVNGVLLRPLPYRDADRIVNVWNDFGEGAQNLPAVTANHWRAYQQMSTTFEDFAAATGARELRATGTLTVAGGALEAERVELGGVSANFFPLLGVAPIIGRQFDASDETFGSAPVVMLSHRLWVRRFASDTGIVGRSILVDGTSHQVIGVLPQEFRLYLPAETYELRDSDIWKPLQIDWVGNPRFRNYTILTVFGRLKDGVSLGAAQQEMSAIAQRLRVEDAANATNLTIRLVPLDQDVVKTVEQGLMTLLGGVSLLVLIACANVANILLARASTRERELTIRLAVGASRRRVMQQLLVESGVFTTIGGLLGAGMTMAAIAYLGYVQPASLPRVTEVGIDWRVLLFVLGLLITVTVLCGLAPALHASRRDLGAALRGTRTTQHGRQVALRDALIVGEIALSVVLLVGAGLLMQSFRKLQEGTPGFRAESAVTFELSMPPSVFPNFDARRAFTMDVIRRVRGIAGVSNAGATSELPLTGQGVTMNYAYDDATLQNWGMLNAERIGVTEDYLKAAGMTLVEGRAVNELDGNDTRVVMIDEQIARKAWPNESAIGKQIYVFPEGAPERRATVVGVVGHARTADLRIDGLPQIYFSYHFYSPATLQFVVRATTPLSSLIPAIREQVASANRAVPVKNLVPFAHYVDEALAPAQFTTWLMQLTGLFALLLAAVGLYSVIAFVVGQRTREFGIRIALGETQGALQRSVITRGLRIASLSVVVGIVCAAFGARFIGPLLYQTNAYDPVTFASVGVFLVVVSALASYVPALRASRVDPLEALRAE